jgi:hypothetical protein
LLLGIYPAPVYRNVIDPAGEKGGRLDSLDFLLWTSACLVAEKINERAAKNFNMTTPGYCGPNVEFEAIMINITYTCIGQISQNILVQTCDKSQYMFLSSF